MYTEFKVKSEVELSTTLVDGLNGSIKFILNKCKGLYINVDEWSIYDTGFHQDSFSSPLPHDNIMDLWKKYRDLITENKKPEFSIIAHRVIRAGEVENSMLLDISLRLTWYIGDSPIYMSVTRSFDTSNHIIITKIDNRGMCKIENKSLEVDNTRLSELETLIKIIID
jgi:hypothetical protein